MISENFHVEKIDGNDCETFKYDDNYSYEINLQRYRECLSSEYDKKKFDTKFYYKYATTYFICICYIIIAAAILCLGMFTNWGNKLFFNDLYVFTISYIVGTILIITYMIYSIWNFKFTPIVKELKYDSVYCPDYWKNKTLKNEDLVSKENGEDKKLHGTNSNNVDFKLKCYLNYDNTTDIYTSKHLADKDTETFKLGKNNVVYIELKPRDVSSVNKYNLNDEDYLQFCEYAATMSGYTLKYIDDEYVLEKNNNNAIQNIDDTYFSDNFDVTGVVPLRIDTVYPLFLAKKDLEYAKKYKINTFNKFRCAYSKACGIPWTEAGCY